jgi:HSP20 family protein
MHTIIHPRIPNRRNGSAAPASTGAYRQPHYDCQEHVDAIKLVVYVPGVDATGVEIEARGADLVITARKSHFVRVNWQSLHLESAQRDYQLRLRLGTDFGYAEMQAEIQDGLLTITLPKRQVEQAHGGARLRRVA